MLKFILFAILLAVLPFQVVSETRPIRIRVIYLQEEYTNAGENLSDELLQHVKDLMEVSKKFFSDLLTVEVQGNFYIEDYISPSYGSIPGDHRLQDGQQEADYFFKSDFADDAENYCDMVIYVASLRNKDASFVANASRLAGFSGVVNSRPKAGQVNINIANFEYSKEDADHQAQFEFNLETILHELFHVFGLSGGSSLPNEDWYEGGGQEPTFIKSPKVLEVARNYFDDQSITKIPFENQGGSGSMGAHWERLLIRNEFMTASTISSDAAISSLSLAFLEDTGMYHSVNHDMAEDCVYWGKGKGQQFIDAATSGDCGNDQYREFASYEKEDSCDFYHFGFGVYTQSTFSNDCYVVSMYKNTDCTNPAHQSTLAGRTYEKNGAHSKCFESDIGSSGQKYKCYQYYCNAPGVLTIQFMDGDSEYASVECTQNEQEHVNPSGLQGTLKCPENIVDFCNYPIPCENYCSENGYCLRKYPNSDNTGEIQSVCHCKDGFGGSDCSVELENGNYIYYDFELNQYISSSTSCEANTEYFEFHQETNLCQFKVCAQTCFDQNQICKGITGTDCIDCPVEGTFFYNDECVSQCPDGYYKKVNGQQTTCLQCTGDVNCLSGTFGLYGNSDTIQLQARFNDIDDQYRNVCSQGFNYNSAQVFCKSQGKKTYKNLKIDQLCVNNIEYVVSQITCNGNESDLDDCTMKFSPSCGANKCIEIECTDDEGQVAGNNEVKSIGDNNLALVNIGGNQGGICATGLGQPELDAICKSYVSEDGDNYTQFNYDYIENRFTDCPSVIAVSDVTCPNDVSGIGNCQKETENPQCSLQSCLAIYCEKSLISSTIDSLKNLAYNLDGVYLVLGILLGGCLVLTMLICCVSSKFTPQGEYVIQKNKEELDYSQ